MRRQVRPDSRPRIVIVGAGFAGLAAARGLDHGYAVTVVDRSASFEWLPNIHQLLSGAKRPRELRLPIRRLAARAGHRFVRAEVTHIDGRAGAVRTADGRQLAFDACIVAVGGVNDTYGVKGADRHAMPFKSVADCAAIGRKLAALARQCEERSVVIVGGGLEGIEALGEILRRFRSSGTLRISVVESGTRLLAGAPPTLDAKVRAHAVPLGVRFRTGSAVTAVTRTRVELRSGERLHSDLTIWTGGVTASPLLRASRLAGKGKSWAPVTPALQSKLFKSVFVVGDAAGLPTPLPKQAYYAMQMGRSAADNVRRWLNGRPMRAFRPEPKPMLVAFGDLDTFLVRGRSVIASPALAWLKEAVFQLTMTEIDPPLEPSALRDLKERLRGLY
jgi:NADH dehydrogenase